MSAVPHSRMGRLHFAAEALTVLAPEGLPVNLLADDGGPHKAVLRFCVDNGVSLDFIYLGDVKGMLREVARYRKAA